MISVKTDQSDPHWQERNAGAVCLSICLSVSASLLARMGTKLGLTLDFLREKPELVASCREESQGLLCA